MRKRFYFQVLKLHQELRKVIFIFKLKSKLRQLFVILQFTYNFMDSLKTVKQELTKLRLNRSKKAAQVKQTLI